MPVLVSRVRLLLISYRALLTSYLEGAAVRNSAFFNVQKFTPLGVGMGRHGPREGALVEITSEVGVEIYVHIAICKQDGARICTCP